MHIYEGIYVLYVSIALMNKTRFDKSLCERTHAYEKIIKNCRFYYERSRDVEIVIRSTNFIHVAHNKKLASRKMALYFCYNNSFYFN